MMMRNLLSLLLGLTAMNFAGESLVNGGFEDNLKGWNSWGGDTTSVSHGGKHACVIRAAEPVWAGIDQSVSIPAGSRTVTVSGWLRAVNLHPGKENWERGRLGVEFHTASGEITGGYPLAVGQVRGEQPWHRVTRTYELPTGATAVRVQCALGNSWGNLYCDDIAVEFGR